MRRPMEETVEVLGTAKETPPRAPAWGPVVASLDLGAHTALGPCCTRSLDSKTYGAKKRDGCLQTDRQTVTFPVCVMYVDRLSSCVCTSWPVHGDHTWYALGTHTQSRARLTQDRARPVASSRTKNAYLRTTPGSRVLRQPCRHLVRVRARARARARARVRVGVRGRARVRARARASVRVRVRVRVRARAPCCRPPARVSSGTA